MDGTREQQLRAAFENIFQEYSDVIYRLCVYKTGSRDAAYDLTQETFLRLWKVVSSGKQIEKPKQYLYQIARNLLADHYQAQRLVSLDELHEDGFDPKAEEGSPELGAEVSVLKAAIDSLEEDFREVMYLRFVEEMKTKDIAEMLGISENLVSVRLNRGKKKLQEKFA